MDNGHRNPIYEQLNYINDLSDPLPKIDIPPSDFSSIIEKYPPMRIGWVCPKCQQSISPYFSSCPNCSNQTSPPKYYEYPPGITPQNPWENGITITCKSPEIDNPSVIEKNKYNE